MQLVSFVQSPPAGRALDAGALATLLDAPLKPAPARSMLAFLNSVAPVSYISMVEYDGDTPSQVEGHSDRADLPNITGRCFKQYQTHFSRADEVTHLAPPIACASDPDAAVAIVFYDRAGIPDAGWRESIFVREHLTGRLSFLYSPLPQKAFAINLYRDEARGGFQPGEIEQLIGIAPILKKVHRAVLQARLPCLPAAMRLPAMLATLQVRAPLLSPREREVCARIACGMGADGIAADLGLAATTVQTLRKRAYAKLAIHGRQQLAHFAH